jgi:hypothetical protein
MAVDNDTEFTPSEEPNPVDPFAQMRETLAEKVVKDRVRLKAKEKNIARPEEYADFRAKGGTKSKDRVQELAEVFTAEREVKAMLDLVGDVARDIRARFLEPACGNGNFLEEVAARKLATVTFTAKDQDEFEFLTALAISSIYGIDISEENAVQARERIRALIVHAYSTVHNTWKPRDGFYRTIEHVLKTNIVVGDSLKGADKIVFVEYSSPAPLKLAQRFFKLSDLEKRQGSNKVNPKPLRIIGAKTYLEVGNGN